MSSHLATDRCAVHRCWEFVALGAALKLATKQHSRGKFAMPNICNRSTSPTSSGSRWHNPCCAALSSEVINAQGIKTQRLQLSAPLLVAQIYCPGCHRQL